MQTIEKIDILGVKPTYFVIADFKKDIIYNDLKNVCEI